jgi:hypothetical protein
LLHEKPKSGNERREAGGRVNSTSPSARFNLNRFFCTEINSCDKLYSLTVQFEVVNMKQLKMTLLAMTVMASLGGSVVAHAEVVTVVTSGKIESGRDYLGIFGVAGRDLMGLSYTQTISADLAQGYTAGGNSHYLNLNNTTTATLTGSTVVGGTTYSWTVNNAHGAFQLAKFQFDGFPNNADQIYLGVNNFSQASGGLKYDIENSVYSNTGSFVSNLNRDQHLIPATNGLQNLSLFTVQNNVGSTSFRATSSVDYVALNPVPEPETWAMMVAGLGVLGVLARRRAKAKT